jgi:hypothetical protein
MLAEEPAEEVEMQKTMYQAVTSTSGQPNCQIIININNNK